MRKYVRGNARVQLLEREWEGNISERGSASEHESEQISERGNYMAWEHKMSEPDLLGHITWI